MIEPANRTCATDGFGEPSYADGDLTAWSRPVGTRQFHALYRLAAWSLTSKSVVSVAGQGTLGVASFATTVLIGRACSKHELGVYALALSIVMVMRAIQGELIAAPLTVYSQRFRGAALASYCGSVLVHQLMACAVSVLVILAVLVVLLTGRGPEGMIPVVLVMLLAAPLLLLRCFTRHFLFARFQFRPSLWLDMLAAVSQLSGIAVLYFLHWLSAATAMAIMGLSCLIVCWTWSGRLTTPLRVNWPRVFDDWKQNWKFARWALPSQLIGSSTPYVMPWILQVARGEAATGSYAACAALIGLSHMFVCGIGNVLTPKATRTYLEGGTKPLCQVLRTTSLVLVAPLSAIVLLLAMFGNDLLVLVFGDKFVGLGPVCVVLSAAAVINSVAVVAGNGLWAVDRPRLNLWGDGATLLATVVAAMLLVQPLGVMGAATATLIGTAAGTIVRGGTLAHCVKRELNLACTN